MAGNEGLFKALQIFQSGMKDLSATIALGKANSAIQEIREDAGLTEEQKTEEFRGIAQQLPAFLAAGGVTGAQIQAVTGQFQAPPTTAEEAFLQGTEIERQRAGQLLQAKTTTGVEAVQRKAAAREIAKVPSKIEDLRAAISADFKRDPIVKLNRLKLLAVANIRGLRAPKTLKDTKFVFNILRRNVLQLAGEKGRFTDRDVKDVNPDPSIRGQILLALNTIIDGTVPENFGERFDELANALEIIAVKDVKALAKNTVNVKFKRIEREAKRAGIVLDFTAEDLVQEVLDQTIADVSVSAPTAGPTITREAALEELKRRGLK